MDACPGRLAAAIDLALKAIDGERLVSLSLAPYFAGGVETEEQLEQALEGIRDEVPRSVRFELIDSFGVVHTSSTVKNVPLMRGKTSTVTVDLPPAI